MTKQTYAYRTDWKEIIISQPIPTEWKDNSWINNGCPSFSHKNLLIWVDHADPKKRENPNTTR